MSSTPNRGRYSRFPSSLRPKRNVCTLQNSSTRFLILPFLRSPTCPLSTGNSYYKKIVPYHCPLPYHRLLASCGNLATATLESVPAPDWWQYIRPNSAVTVNGTLFIGEKYGIVRVDQKMNFQYYPVTNSNFIDSN